MEFSAPLYIFFFLGGGRSNLFVIRDRSEKSQQSKIAKFS